MSLQRMPYLIVKGHANSIDLWLRTDPVGAALSATRAILYLGDYQMDSRLSNNINIIERLNEDNEYIYIVSIKPGLEDDLPAGDYQCRLIIYNDAEWKNGIVWDDAIEIGIIT